MHGLLHTIGYDHRTRKEEQRMKKKCQEYLSDD
jgi:ssRNA-specific RNase YbeY (16S rRNA maturation enzyme)